MKRPLNDALKHIYAKFTLDFPFWKYLKPFLFFIPIKLYSYEYPHI